MAMISVIIPIYNVEAYIHRCVDSILGQSFSDFELILVDDGSPDNCGVICDEYASRDSRVHVIHQENGGLSAARNAGIDWVFDNSDSQWITFVDSDDWVHPQMLEKLFDAAMEQNTLISICGFIETTGDTPCPALEIGESRLWSAEEYYIQHNVNATIACGKLLNRECMAGIRFPVGKLHEDEFTTHKILFSEEKIAVINSPLYFYFQNEQGITKSKWTPKRLDMIDSVREQAQYLKDRGYAEAYRFAIRKYVYCLNKNITDLQNSDCDDKIKKQFNRILTRQSINFLWKYKGWYGKEELIALCYHCFPKIRNLYIKIRGCLARK